MKNKAHATLSAEALYAKAREFQDRQSYAEALAIFEQMTKRFPGQPELFFRQGAMLFLMGNSHEALKKHQQALALAPDHVAILNAIANCYFAMNDKESAREYYGRVLKLMPDSAHAIYNLTQFERFKQDDPRLRHAESLYPSASGEDKVLLGFALGKMWEDAGDIQRAFTYYAEANATKQSLINYSPEGDLAFMEDIKRVFDRAFFEARKGQGSDDETPVFIIGMPRSGSTLIEQILDAHPSIYGVGEVNLMPQLAQRSLAELTGQPFPQSALTLKPKDIRPQAAQYVRQIKALTTRSTSRIADKMLTNYLYAGIIHLLLPRARIIHSRRDPMDTCWSIFRQHFSGHHYMYDQRHLASIYKAYQSLMDHWQEVIPGVIHTVDYEALVEAPEENARRLIDYCGLEWDAACLDFHKTKRSVATASAMQVRQPIYKTSIQSWQPVAQGLSALQAGLE